MKKEDYNKVENQLQKQYKQNNQRIKELEYKNEILTENGVFSSKNLSSILIGGLVFGFTFLFSNTLSNIIPFTAKIMPELCFSASMITGIITSKNISKNEKLKEKLKEFSTAKKRVELLDESVKNELEIQMLTNKNKVLDRVINNLKSDLSTSDNLTENGISTCELNNNINIIEDIIERKFEDLNILITKKLLQSKIQVSRKFKKASKFIIPMSVAALFAGIYCSPQLMIGLENVLYRLSISFVLSCLFSYAFLEETINAREKVFKKYNNELGISEITEEYNSDKGKTVNLKIESMINNISNMMVELEKAKIQLNTLESNNDKDLGEKNKSYDNKINQLEEESSLNEEKGIQFTKKIKYDNRH